LQLQKLRLRAGCFELVPRGRVLGEEGEDAAAEFFGEEAVGGGVIRAGNDPKLFRAPSGGVNHFRMAAGKRDILFVTDQKNRKRARGDGLLRGNFRDRETREFFVAVEQRPSEGREKSFAEPGIFSQAGVVVSSFAKIGERSFRYDSFDARIGRRGLQRDARAHGFA
jgi:hypothetical protein